MAAVKTFQEGQIGIGTKKKPITKQKESGQEAGFKLKRNVLVVLKLKYIYLFIIISLFQQIIN